MNASRPIKFLSLCIAMLLMILASGCQYILPAEEEPLAPPLVVPRDVDYTTVDVARGNLVNSVQGVGKLESVKLVDIYFTAGGGRIKSTNVKLGDTVKKGDVLIQLNVDDLNYQLSIAQLRLKQMENSYSSMEKQMKRARDKTPLKNAEIDLQIQRLEVKHLKDQIENATLRAPIDGSVVYVTYAHQGSYVDAYTTLVRVADQSVKMLTYMDDLNRPYFQIGMKVQVTLVSDKSTTEGEVVSTPFERDKYDDEKLNKMLFIKVPDEFLANTKVGQEAKLVLILGERQNVLKIPRSVVRTYLQRKYVQVLVDGVKVEKDIQTGLETATEVEIISGLEEGEKVIVR